ncbi:MAG: FAD-dependent oxidoreductase, partial [Actinomycetota bacterium]|nr:FAD-dependent oxidoreductase [Actinomycetota bacterium]
MALTLGAARPSAVVVGAGIFGGSIAQALAIRGWAVQIVEQHSPAHVRASSHDSSRLLRMGHGDEDLPDHWYARSALRSRS